jgi:hypothetical protein
MKNPVTRRDLLKQAGPEGRAEPQRDAPPVKWSPLRAAILGAAVLFWLCFLYPTMQTVGEDGAREIRLGLSASPWLVILLGGTRSPSSVIVHAISFSWLLAFLGLLLFRASSRPRAIALLRRAYTETREN